jgi:hypothetical protein
MVWKYPGRFCDQSGEEAIIIANDGKELRTTIRGVEFWGTDFDSLEPAEDQDPTKIASFDLCRPGRNLASCVIEWEMPIPVVVGQKTENWTLLCRLELGRPMANGGMENENLHLELVGNKGRFRSYGKSGFFEDELSDVQRQLLADTYMKACINCAFSDYSPGGHGLFGCLACFRGDKDSYRAVHSKKDIFAIWSKMTEYVQETYLCPEFERRLPGTGYRG